MNIGKQAWNDVKSDAAGKYLYAVAVGGYIYVSANFGDDWEQANDLVGDWLDVTTDATGIVISIVSLEVQV